MNKVEQRFLIRAIKRGGIYMFSKSDAIEFVNECKKENIAILGIDAFLLRVNSTQPSMNNSIDYSMQPYNEDIYRIAIDFLAARDEQFYFDIVCRE
jgi:hypothetical protein